jgi:hypothetical protein
MDYIWPQQLDTSKILIKSVRILITLSTVRMGVVQRGKRFNGLMMNLKLRNP